MHRIKGDTFILISLGVMFCCLFPLNLYSQKSTIQAYNEMKEGDYVQAAEYIELAVLDSRGKSKSKTWRYRAQIYLGLTKSPATRSKFPDALFVTFESLKKARELDIKELYKRELIVMFGEVQSIAGEYGTRAYNNQNFERAADYFSLSVETAAEFNITDEAAMFNYALCMEKSGDFDRAVEGYLRCAEVNHQVPDTYFFAANICLQQNRSDKAIEIFKAAWSRHPNHALFNSLEEDLYFQIVD
jgi:tetratricopeptide (TPR) repeat protein